MPKILNIAVSLSAFI